MGRPDFGRLAASPVLHHLHNDGDATDGDAVEGLQHGLLAEPEAEAEPGELESVDPLGFCWRVPLSWVNNSFGVLALYRD